MGVVVRCCLVALGLLLPACGMSEQRWAEDVDYLARELPRLHPEPFLYRSRQAFEQDILALKADLPRLDNEAAYCRLRQIVASLGDAHTDVRWYPINSRVLPIRLKWLEDGFYVTEARPEHADLIGCRLGAVGEVPVETVRDKIATLLPHENDHWVLARFTHEVVITGQLHYLGLSAHSDRARFLFRPPNGESVSRELEAVAFEGAYDNLRGAFEEEETALSYRNHNQAYWFTCFDEAKAIYLQYNRCEETRPLSEFAEKFWRTADAGHVERIVVDLRNNLGGSSPLFAAFLDGIRERPVLNRLGHVWVLIGPDTFSSGLMNAMELRSRTQAILVGRPTGGKPNGAGEIKSFRLPNCEARVSCSSKAFRQTETDVATLEPDVPMGVSATDYFAGRDPVLDYALTHGEADVERFREAVAARQGEIGRANRARLESWPQKPIVCDSDAILGLWEGAITEGSREKPLVFRFVRGEDGEVRGFIDSPAEEALGVHIESGEFREGRLHFAISKVGLTFDGALDEGGKALKGTNRQEERTVEMVLRRKVE